MKKPTVTFYAFITLLSFSSCERILPWLSGGSLPGNGCRITHYRQEYSPSLARTADFEYDAQGRLTLMSVQFNGNTNTRQYTYGVDSNYVQLAKNGTHWQTIAYTTNPRGFVDFVRWNAQLSGGWHWGHATYNYRGFRLQSIDDLTRTTANPTGVHTTYTFTWAGGNRVQQETAGTPTVEYEFFTNYANQTGFGMIFHCSLIGLKTVVNQNLLKKMSPTDSTYSDFRYEYTFDADGKVATMEKFQIYPDGLEGHNSSLTFTYNCD